MISGLVKTTPPKNLCTIDASTNSLAFALFIDGELKSYGKIKYQGSDIYAKISDIAHKTKAFFDVWQVDTIVIEDTIFANSPKTAAQLAKAQGALVAAANLGGVKSVYAISPITWQSYVGTKLLTPDEKKSIKVASPGKSVSWYKGKERDTRKNKTIATVNERFGLNLSDNDIADALGIGIFSLENWGRIVDGKK